MPGIRYTTSNSDDDETSAATGNDFFDIDPFKFLFSDEDQGSVDESRASPAPRLRRKSKARTSAMDAIVPSIQRQPEEREPREMAYPEREETIGRRKQHYWRRNQPRAEAKGLLGFGRKPPSKRMVAASAASGGTSIESTFISEPAEIPEHSVVSSLQSSFKDEGTETEEGFSSLMKALGRPWDPWDDPSSSSESSRLSYETGTYETGTQVTHTDESFLSSRIGGAVRDQPESQVQQVLVQYNPKSGIREPKPELTSSFHGPSKRQEALYTDGSALRTLPAKQYYAPEIVHFEDDSIVSYAQSQADTNCDSDEESSPRCLRVCGVRKKKKVKGSPSSTGTVETELVSVFPKLRMVSDEKVGGLKASSIVPNDKNFNGSIPAHLQVSMDAFLPTRGPQSLYEYEYEGAEHVDVAYNHFGTNPLSLLVIRHHLNPPRSRHGVAIVQVEASTISMTDCSIRRGEWEGKETPPLPITPGVDIVGKIFHIDKDVSTFLNLSTGERVISLTRCGGNSRFLSISPDQLVKVSADVDPAEAACLAETYLTAFQIMHFGQGMATRYRSNSLKGKNILVIGSVSTTLGHAFVELAMAAGVEKIIATSLPKHFPQLRSLGIIPVSPDPTLWYGQLDEQIDLVFVSNPNEDIVADHFRVLNEKGHLFVVGQRGGSPIDDEDEKLRASALVCKRRKSKPSMIERTHEYSPFRQWEQDLEKCKKDLSHLVKMLGRGEIRPNVLDRIPLGKVAKAQDMVESQRHPGGFLVCEPWLRNKKRAVRL